MDSRLRTLAEAFGVATSYEDWRRRPVEVAESTVRRVLEGLGVDVEHPEEELRRAEHRRQRRLLPPTVVAVEGERVAGEVRGPDVGRLTAELTLEDGTVRPLEMRRADQDELSEAELSDAEPSDVEPDTETAGHSDIVPDDGGVFAGRVAPPGGGDGTDTVVAGHHRRLRM